MICTKYSLREISYVNRLISINILGNQFVIGNFEVYHNLCYIKNYYARITYLSHFMAHTHIQHLQYSVQHLSDATRIAQLSSETCYEKCAA